MVSQDSTRDRWNPDPFENKQQIQEQLNLCCIARLNTGGAQESGQEHESSQDAENTPPLLSSGKKHIPFNVAVRLSGERSDVPNTPLSPYRFIAIGTIIVWELGVCSRAFATELQARIREQQSRQLGGYQWASSGAS